MMKSSTIDLRGVPCPLNSAKAIIAIESVAHETAITIFVDDGEPFINVTETIIDEGHRILKKEKKLQNYWELNLVKHEV